MRCCVVAVLVVGFSSLTACGGALAPQANLGARAAGLGTSSSRYQLLYSFKGFPDAQGPWGGLLAGKKGEYYGTSTDGGPYGGNQHEGTVYEITAGGKEKVLYGFQGQPDGAHPQAPLILDKDGALYGTTTVGGGSSNCYYGYGSGGCGTVFKLTPGKRGWSESVLYSFQGGFPYQNDGTLPTAGLLMTKSGALLGTTSGGGNGAEGGIVFELTPSGSTYTETIVHAFNGTPDGLGPDDALVSDNSGNLYGTTAEGGLIKPHCHKFGGGGGCGTVFKLTPSGSTYSYSVIYRFKGGASDGSHPSSGLLLRPNGLFYGLTIEGGGVKTCPRGCGTVFSITASGSEHVVYRFQGGTDGFAPDDTPGLAADESGNLYGTTPFGGGQGSGGGNTACGGGCGTVFKLAPSKKGWTESVLYAFGGSGGALPYGSVVVDRKGNLLGPTWIGGNYSRCACGTIFSITP
ncbi:MAG TPA: choice-of-anchor tandem repeat GloVer-containing protein [Candidatus Cybelea sp.]|jgi:uncharacterized protein YceK